MKCATVGINISEAGWTPM